MGQGHDDDDLFITDDLSSPDDNSDNTIRRSLRGLDDPRESCRRSLDKAITTIETMTTSSSLTFSPSTLKEMVTTEQDTPMAY
ncbi:unnamed protein product [Linum trigynum]|uniref:Uncharacterized protein n=1 Tax=Linum trigynum TaxID=586398 RepID=A0AAV2GWR8_9ROSI